MSEYSKPKWYEVNLNFEVGYTKRPNQITHLEFDKSYFDNIGVFAASISEVPAIPTPNIRLKAEFIRPATLGNSSAFGKSGVARAGTRLYVPGIDNTIVVSSPKQVSWRKFINLNEGIGAQESFYSVKRVRMKGGYNPPPPSSIVLNWFEANPYSPPPPLSATLEFGALGYGYVFASVGDVAEFGQAVVGTPDGLKVQGFDASLFGQATVDANLKRIFVNAFADFDHYGNPHVNNNARKLIPPSIAPFDIVKPTIYNLKQMVTVKGFQEFNYFGVAFVGGGIKNVTLSGILGTAFGTAKVVSTNRELKVEGIKIPDNQVPRHNVSPRYLAPVGILSMQFGMSMVRRNPSPLGFINSDYGNAWISHSPRYITPAKVESYLSGYAIIKDPSRRIYIPSILGNGVFGDIAIRNNRRLIAVPGLFAFEGSDWGSVESNRRGIYATLGTTMLFGETAIRNKSPSIAPPSIVGVIGNHAIGYRIRSIIGRGNDLLNLGVPKLTQPPSLVPVGRIQSEYGTAFISNHTRSFELVGGINSQKFGNTTVWFRIRGIKTAGLAFEILGKPTLNHSNRRYELTGYNNLSMGAVKVEFRVRYVEPKAIYAIRSSNHKVGGTQYVQPLGYVASLFGSRIIPESRNLYLLGFAGDLGIPMIQLFKRYLRVSGFKTADDGYISRWGTANTYNLRQYITQQYDPLDGLNPPFWSLWTNIKNRNVSSYTTGWDAAKYGYTLVANKATPLLPAGINDLAFGKPMIAERVRPLHIPSIEAPLISTWSKIHNDARVIHPVAFRSDVVGTVERVFNTRRYFPYIGAMFTQAIGEPMISYRIRHIIGDQRYGIAPPRINMPVLQLHTRYIDVPGMELYSSGAAHLDIKFNIITPRWTLRNDYGYPTVKNLTPELPVRGYNMEEFGQPAIRLQWRPLNVHGSDMVLFGRTKIADRKQWINVAGTNMFGFGSKLTVVKTGAPPYSLQQIWLDGIEYDGESMGNYGIEPPKDQVPRPGFNQNVIYPASLKPMTEFGRVFTWSNNLEVSPGIGTIDDAVPQPTIRLDTQIVTAQGIAASSVVEKPRFSPWTIYAVIDAPGQAQRNHEIPRQQLHVIESMSRLGTPTLTNQHRTLTVVWDLRSPLPASGVPSIQLRKRYINVFGINTMRFGWHEIPSKFKYVEQYDALNSMEFGRPSISIPYYGPIRATARGSDAALYGRALVEYKNRVIGPLGLLATAMGSSRPDSLFNKPQSLHIGPPVPTKPPGEIMTRYGVSFISHRVRQVHPAGFDAFISTYTVSNFKSRMKVSLANIIVPDLNQVVGVVGILPEQYSTPDIKLAVHYIRPDGNTDQYRKGVPK